LPDVRFFVSLKLSPGRCGIRLVVDPAPERERSAHAGFTRAHADRFSDISNDGEVLLQSELGQEACVEGSQTAAGDPPAGSNFFWLLSIVLLVFFRGDSTKYRIAQLETTGVCCQAALEQYSVWQPEPSENGPCSQASPSIYF
jgi:hypothetical protein